MPKILTLAILLLFDGSRGLAGPTLYLIGDSTVRNGGGRGKYFTATDHTHTTEAGAKLNAALVAGAIRKLSDVSLADALRPESAASASEQVYLFSYFIGNGEDGLHLAGSRDGYQ